MQAVLERPHTIELDEDESYRHWCPQSEKYSPADALMNALQHGWHVSGVVFRQEVWHSPARRVVVYHFRLENDADCATIAVVENPFLLKLLRKIGARVVYQNQRKETKAERW